ncbi:MAG: hypothetical protein JNL57_06275 [Bacteroidetes bacterium]|nr:hypothetical protein [Bacteroidota bacterium]
MRLLFLAAPLLFGVACNGNSTTQSAPKDTAAPKKKADTLTKLSPGETRPVDSALTGFARYIAGMDGPAKYKALQAESWINYSKTNTAKWTELQNKIGSNISNWVKEAKLERENEPRTLFYPFAGGDFYYANLFFPNQDTTIMIGLEPGGSIFMPDSVKPATLATYYSNLQHSMFFPHWLGFFRTKSMAVDFNKGPLNGTLHTCLFYLAQGGYSLHYIEHFNLDKDGRETDVVQAAQHGRGKKYTAYRIGYSKPGSPVRQLVYFSYDASNENMKARPNLLNWLNRRGKVVTFFKAASYLMHYDMFSTVRNFVNNRSTRLLQDDSGLPYAFMLKNNFEVKLLGKYTKTIALFANEFQPDMKAAYAKAQPATLPFMIGYNAEFRECNLQAAWKKP